MAVSVGVGVPTPRERVAVSVGVGVPTPREGVAVPVGVAPGRERVAVGVATPREREAVSVAVTDDACVRVAVSVAVGVATPREREAVSVAVTDDACVRVAVSVAVGVATPREGVAISVRLCVAVPLSEPRTIAEPIGVGETGCPATAKILENKKITLYKLSILHTPTLFNAFFFNPPSILIHEL